MKKIAFALVLIVVVYFGAYFVLMEPGTALNPDTMLPEYESISKFAEGLRISGPVEIKVTESHWTNPVFEPLDRLFR